MYSRMSWEATSGLMPIWAQHGRGRLIRPKRASSANRMRFRASAVIGPPRSVINMNVPPFVKTRSGARRLPERLSSSTNSAMCHSPRLAPSSSSRSSANAMSAARPSSHQIFRLRNGRASSKASVSPARCSIASPTMSIFWSSTARATAENSCSLHVSLRDLRGESGGRGPNRRRSVKL
jgi:hypothetical protein